jgi:hypothetical protein
MLYFKQCLFLTTGLATALILRNPASTDSLGVFGRSSISVLDGVHALENPRISQKAPTSDGKELESYTPSREDDQPTTETRVDGVTLVHRASNDLGLAQFTSPDDKRKFVVGLASQVVTSAYWAFDMWFTQREGNTIYRVVDILARLALIPLLFPPYGHSTLPVPNIEALSISF